MDDWLAWGCPPWQDTLILMPPPVALWKITLATGAGPRKTSSASNPLYGLTYSRYAWPCWQVATAVPSDEVSSVPGFEGGDGDGDSDGGGLFLDFACGVPDGAADGDDPSSGTRWWEFSSARSELTMATDTCVLCCMDRS